MPTINNKIVTGVDDGDLEWVNYTTYKRYYGHTSMAAGFLNFFGVKEILYGALRFQSVNIPQGATVSSATLTMVKKSVNGVPGLKVYGNNVDNAGAWGTTNRVKNISKTAHSASVDTASATSVNNITAIVQDIVNRGGWSANNAMAFGIFNTKAIGATSAISYWNAYAYEKGGADIPAISITYSTGPTPTPTGDAIWFGSFF